MNAMIKNIDMNEKVCIITGANSGIGKAVALGLAKLGATIVMICRNKQRGEDAQREIINASGNQNVDLLLCDLSSQEQIHELAAEFKKKYKCLHVLINNAGIVLYKRTISVDGIEMNFAVNYLAPFLLTNLLIELLKKNAPSRIINVSSSIHTWVSLNIDDIQSQNKKYLVYKNYSNSKLALLLFTYELSNFLDGTGVTVNAVHPGFIRTGLGRDLPFFVKAIMKIFFKSPEKGAKTIIYLASSQDVAEITGKYYVKGHPKKSSEESYNKEKATQLWNLSLQMTNL